uniref:LVIVD repeat-containing protein n=1 Tax=uncultured marine group II/III euryarchaeote KM3_190_A12 TaxID=1457961 RepID=A0A075GR04_9EURY|nr:LVIVD repeat-containing protein [uncultured marine group II/III euryarchaeote KM3_190_A12]
MSLGRAAALSLALLLLALASFSPAVAGTPQVELEPVATVGLSGHFKDMALGGGYLYALIDGELLQVIDVSEPANATIVDNISLNIHANKVHLSGSYAYVFWGYLQVLDISQPASITNVKIYQDISQRAIIELAISEPYAYAITGHGTYTDPGFLTLNISDPSNVTPLAFIEFYEDSRHYSNDVLVNGDYVYFDTMQRLNTVNVSDPGAPSMVASNALPFNFVGGLALDCHYIYASSGTGSAIIYDISNPALLREVAKIPGVSTLRSDITVADNYLFMSVSGGLRIFDILDPSNPVEISQVEITHRTEGVIVSGGYTYVRDFGNVPSPGKLHIYRLTDHRQFPDLAFTDGLRVNRALLPENSEARLRATVVNNGLGPTAPAEAVLQLENELLASFPLPALEAGETWTLDYNLSDLPPGMHQLNLTLYQECAARETSLENNYAVVALRVVAADGAVASFALGGAQLLLAAMIAALLTRRGANFDGGE